VCDFLKKKIELSVGRKFNPQLGLKNILVTGPFIWIEKIIIIN
jgi:hypothetical protein